MTVKLCPGDFVLKRNYDVYIVSGSARGGYDISNPNVFHSLFNHNEITLKNNSNCPEYDIMIVLDGSTINDPFKDIIRKLRDCPETFASHKIKYWRDDVKFNCREGFMPGPLRRTHSLDLSPAELGSLAEDLAKSKEQKTVEKIIKELNAEVNKQKAAGTLAESVYIALYDHDSMKHAKTAVQQLVNEGYNATIEKVDAYDDGPNRSNPDFVRIILNLSNRK